MNLFNKLKDFGIDGFLLSLFGAIVLAYLSPSLGASSSPFHLSEMAGWGVSLIFFFYGLRLSVRSLKEGLSNIRLHFTVQSSTFILFPLLALLLKPILVGTFLEPFWLGIFFLCALPSTVSSSVVMVGIAGGNLPAAIFNASVSSLLGVFLTPLWMGIVMSQGADSVALGDVIIKLCVQVLIPVLLGVLLNKKGDAWAKRNAKRTKLFDQATIVLIVYTSFCDSFLDGIFSTVSTYTLLGLTITMVAMFYLVLWLVRLTCTKLGFNDPDRITAEFCGSKKSLVQGAVMSKVLFANPLQAGIILLPIMIYHSSQLIIVGMMARKYAKRSEA